MTNAVIFTTTRESVLLTLRQDHPVWCLPGGYVEEGESILDSVRREVREEIGCDLEGYRFFGLYSEANLKLTFPSKRRCIVSCFRIECGALEPGVSDEVRESRFFPLDALPNTLLENHRARIFDAKRGEITIT